MTTFIPIHKLQTSLHKIKSGFKRAFWGLPLFFVALSPLQTAYAAGDSGSSGSGNGGNNQANVLIQPTAPSAGETISGHYTIKVDTPTVSTASSELQYCLRPGEETTDLVSAVEAAAEDGTTTEDSECTWAPLTANGANSWSANVDTTTYADGLYTIPFLLKASGVTGQKYAFIKNVTIANDTAEDAAPTVALQTINVTHSSRPTDAPIRGTALVQGKIVGSNLDSYQLTIYPSDEAGTPTPGAPAVYDSGSHGQINAITAFTTLYEWDTTSIADGNYVITLTAKDKGGQESTTTLMRKVDNVKGGDGSDPSEEDGETSALEAVSPTSGSYISGRNYLVKVHVTDSSLLFDKMVLRLQSGSGSGEESSAVTSGTLTAQAEANSGQGSEPTEEEGNSPWLNMHDAGNGYWEYHFDTTQYADGVYWMHIRAEVVSGEVVTDVATSVRITNLSVDNTPPTVSLNQGNQTTKSPIHRQGTAQDGSGIAGYQWSKISGPGNVTFSLPNAAETDITADANGDYVIQLAATDLAGNTGTASFTMTWYDPALVPASPVSPITAAPSSGTSTIKTLTNIVPAALFTNADLTGSSTAQVLGTSTSTPDANSQEQITPTINTPGTTLGTAKPSADNSISPWWLALPAGLISLAVAARLAVRKS